MTRVFVSFCVTLSILSTFAIPQTALAQIRAEGSFNAPQSRARNILRSLYPNSNGAGNCAYSFTHPELDKLKNRKFDYLEFERVKRSVLSNEFNIANKQELSAEEVLAIIETLLENNEVQGFKKFQLKEVPAKAILKFAKFYENQLKDGILNEAELKRLALELYKLRLAQLDAGQPLVQKLLRKYEYIPEELVLKRLEETFLSSNVNDIATALGMQHRAPHLLVRIKKFFASQYLSTGFFGLSIYQAVKSRQPFILIPQFSYFRFTVSEAEVQSFLSHNTLDETYISLVQRRLKSAQQKSRLNFARTAYNGVVSVYLMSQALLMGIGEYKDQLKQLELDKQENAQVQGQLQNLEEVLNAPGPTSPGYVDYQISNYKKFVRANEGREATDQEIAEFKIKLQSAIDKLKDTSK